MTEIINKYYNKVQDIMLKGNSSDFDNDEYSHIVNNLEERYYKRYCGKENPYRFRRRGTRRCMGTFQEVPKASW